MSEITFRPPGPDAPGYLRRQRQALEFAEAIKANPSPALIDRLVEMLLPFVIEPQDRQAARDALLDASETQFLDLLRVMQGRAGGDPL